MVQNFDLKKYRLFLLSIIPIVCFLIVQTKGFQLNSNLVSMGIIIDLVLITPLLYWILIWKTHISKLTVFTVAIVGIFLASFILPTENQGLLETIKSWAIPTIELLAIAYLVYTVINALKSKKNEATSTDFYSTTKKACDKILPPIAANLLTTEIAILYYGLFDWKKRTVKSTDFSYHKETGSIAVLYVIVLLIVIETMVIHFLLMQWSTTAAWVLSIISLYTVFQVFGIARSIPKRPMTIENGMIHLRWGIMNETSFKIKSVEYLQKYEKEVPKKANRAFLSPLHQMEGHNVHIKLSENRILQRFYGRKKCYNEIFLWVDSPNDFIKKTGVHSRND